MEELEKFRDIVEECTNDVCGRQEQSREGQ